MEKTVSIFKSNIMEMLDEIKEGDKIVTNKTKEIRHTVKVLREHGITDERGKFVAYRHILTWIKK
jgi:S-adenosylmethionine:tRNA-ribosyltransferase-isomerase (queuine synthetase)